MIPKSGGTYIYVLECMGPIPAFLFSWTCALILMPASVSAIALSFGYYMAEPLYPNHDCEDETEGRFNMVSKLFACLCICEFYTLALINISIIFFIHMGWHFFQILIMSPTTICLISLHKSKKMSLLSLHLVSPPIKQNNMSSTLPRQSHSSLSLL